MVFNENSGKKVDFSLLLQLVREYSADSENALLEVIELLAMEDIPMTEAVIRLGIIGGVLLPGYICGWSEDLD